MMSMLRIGDTIVNLSYVAKARLEADEHGRPRLTLTMACVVEYEAVNTLAFVGDSALEAYAQLVRHAWDTQGGQYDQPTVEEIVDQLRAQPRFRSPQPVQE